VRGEGSGVSQDVRRTPALTPDPSPLTPEVTIDEFAKLDLRVAEVLAAERVAGADKLLQFRVNLGTEERTVLAGVAPYYEPQTLVGRKIVLIANLAPRKIRGLVSHGMILAADAGEGSGGVALLSPDKDAAPGSRVR